MVALVALVEAVVKKKKVEVDVLVMLSQSMCQYQFKNFLSIENI